MKRNCQTFCPQLKCFHKEEDIFWYINVFKEDDSFLHMGKIYLLTEMMPEQVERVFERNLFEEKNGKGTVINPADGFHNPGPVEFLGMTALGEGDLRGVVFLDMVYACNNAGLPLPQTNIALTPTFWADYVLTRDAENCIRGFKQTKPFALYDSTKKSLDADLLKQFLQL
ncbi:MAG: hypothetical protein RL557_914 [archaeon]|jgi:hypothetical protein